MFFFWLFIYLFVCLFCFSFIFHNILITIKCTSVLLNQIHCFHICKSPQASRKQYQFTNLKQHVDILTLIKVHIELECVKLHSTCYFHLHKISKGITQWTFCKNSNDTFDVPLFKFLQACEEFRGYEWLLLPKKDKSGNCFFLWCFIGMYIKVSECLDGIKGALDNFNIIPTFFSKKKKKKWNFYIIRSICM